MVFAELCETGGTSWVVYLDREDNLAFLTGLRSVKGPGFFPLTPRTYCEGDLTAHEGLVALGTWKHSSAEDRVGLAAQSNDGELRPQKEESRAPYSALLLVSIYS
jgi:hypothetical protein